MNACKDVMSNKLANQLFYNGSIQCDECEGKREFCQNAYPLHMLVKHGIFIGTQAIFKGYRSNGQTVNWSQRPV
jgi:hypothetical protein